MNCGSEHDLATMDRHPLQAVQCIVTACVPSSEIVGIQVVSGSPAIGDELLCTETGWRYRLVSFGMSPHPDMYDKGRWTVLLSPIAGSMAESPLQRGMHLVKDWPAHLRTTLQLLQRAFPAGIGEGEYLSLLSALYPHMADENLALAMSEHTGRDIAVVLNDILLAGSRTDVISEADDRVRRRLWDAGFDAWVAEEDG